MTVAFSRVEDALTIDPTIAWRMQFDQLNIGLEIEDGADQTVLIGPERIELKEGVSADSHVVLTAKASAWDEFAKDEPAVGYQTIASLIEEQHMRVRAGDIMDYARNAMMLEKLFATLRQPKTLDAAPHAEIEIEDITGRYIRMNLEGRPHRIYFEEAGQGTPLLCLHTAGADGRQYRALLNDPEITKDFRVIVFDLPWHGKSSPPPGFHLEHYRLTTDKYVDTVMAFKNALNLDQPVVMGCSIGGRAVLHLGLRHGSAFKAAIGLQSAMHAESRSQTQMGLLDKHVLYRPDVHGGEVSAASVMGIMSPNSPAKDEWETLWHYMQGGPGIFAGDLYYYFVDGDLRNGLVDGYDTDECPLYLLTGEYDLSASPEMTAELATAVGATHFEVMKGLGHFPMSENPEQFRKYLLPVLEKIKAQ